MYANVISHAKINLQVPIAGIQQQLRAPGEYNWKAHLNTRDYDGEWTVLPLRSPGGRDTIIPDLMGIDSVYLDTPLMEQCPAVKQLLDSMDCEKMSARLLNLKKGAIIKPHRDRELAFEKGEARIHFPVFTNAAVEFYIEDERIIMNEGECWYINANLKHSVANHGDADRIHLIVDCKVNKWMEVLFEQAQKKYAQPVEETEHWKKMIPQLRDMGTSTALAMAHDMECKLKALSGN